VLAKMGILDAVTAKQMHLSGTPVVDQVGPPVA